MIHKLSWHCTLIALLLSTALVVSSAQKTLAKIVHVKQIQLTLQVDCHFFTFPPIQSNQTLRADGALYCGGDWEKTELTVQLQQFTEGQWVTLEKGTEMNTTDLEVFAPCARPEKTSYRTYVTGRYKTPTGWHAVPKHDEATALLACK